MYGDCFCSGTGQPGVKRKIARRRLRDRRRSNKEEEEEEEEVVVDLVEEVLRTPARFGDRRHNNYFQASHLSCPRKDRKALES